MKVIPPKSPKCYRFIVTSSNGSLKQSEESASSEVKVLSHILKTVKNESQPSAPGFPGSSVMGPEQIMRDLPQATIIDNNFSLPFDMDAKPTDQNSILRKRIIAEKIVPHSEFYGMHQGAFAGIQHFVEQNFEILGANNSIKKEKDTTRGDEIQPLSEVNWFLYNREKKPFVYRITENKAEKGQKKTDTIKLSMEQEIEAYTKKDMEEIMLMDKKELADPSVKKPAPSFIIRVQATTAVNKAQPNEKPSFILRVDVIPQRNDLVYTGPTDTKELQEMELSEMFPKAIKIKKLDQTPNELSKDQKSLKSAAMQQTAVEKAAAPSKNETQHQKEAVQKGTLQKEVELKKAVKGPEPKTLLLSEEATKTQKHDERPKFQLPKWHRKHEEEPGITSKEKEQESPKSETPPKTPPSKPKGGRA